MQTCKYFNKCSDYPTFHQHCKPSSQELALCFRYTEIKVWSLTYWARSNYRKEISQSLQQQWGALPFSQPEVLEEDLSLAALVRISQHGMEITEKVRQFFFLRPRVKRGPAWLVHCNNNPVAEAKLFMSPRKLNGHDFFLYQRVSQKMCLMNDSGNLLLKNSVLCLTASVLIIMDMSCLKWSLISGFQMCFPTIWVTIIFAVNFSRRNQTEFNFVQTSSVYLNGQSITFMIHLSQNEILIEWCCHFRELSFFKLHFELMWGLLYSSRRMRWDYMVDGAGRQSKEKSFFHHDPIFSCVYNFWNLSRIIQATAKRAVV